MGLAYSRSLTAFISLAVAGGLWLCFHHWWTFRYQKRIGRELVILWLLLAVGLVGSVAVGYRVGVLSRVSFVWGQIQEGDWTTVTTGRSPVYWLSWQMIQEQPWLGRGLNTFGREFFFYRANTEVGQSANLIKQAGSFQEVHNEYLQVWLELGLPGLVFFLALVLFFSS